MTQSGPTRIIFFNMKNIKVFLKENKIWFYLKPSSRLFYRLIFIFLFLFSFIFIIFIFIFISLYIYIKQAKTWVFINHKPTDPNSVLNLLFNPESTQTDYPFNLVFKIEPLILAVECNDQLSVLKRNMKMKMSCKTIGPTQPNPAQLNFRFFVF